MSSKSFKHILLGILLVCALITATGHNLFYDLLWVSSQYIGEGLFLYLGFILFPEHKRLIVPVVFYYSADLTMSYIYYINEGLYMTLLPYTFTLPLIAVTLVILLQLNKKNFNKLKRLWIG